MLVWMVVAGAMSLCRYCEWEGEVLWLAVCGSRVSPGWGGGGLFGLWRCHFRELHQTRRERGTEDVGVCVAGEVYG